jgi:isopentenyl phosphate kinase
MAKTDLEKTSEEGMVPLVFLDVVFSGKSRYKRLDTGEILVERVELLMQDRLSVIMNYSGEGTIKMKPALKEANGLLFSKYPDTKEQLCVCHYCKIHPEEEKKDEKTRTIFGFTIPLN